MKISKRGPLVVVFGMTMIAPLLWTATAAYGSSNPPGNNGTVKVEGETFDHYHDNDPHVGCTFFVQWYGFDAGTRTTTVTFDAQPPTGSAQGETLLTDTFTFTGSGAGNALDAQKQYDLTTALAGYTPQPQQGFHVELRVNTDYAQGSDVKHKVFWVSGCTDAELVTTTTTTAPTTTAPPTTLGFVATSTTGRSGVLGEDATVLGNEVQRSASLPRTGSGATGMLALAGLCLILVGAALTTVEKRIRLRN